MAQLLTGTRVYGNTSIDSQLIVANVTPFTSTSNTTGSLIVTGGVGISGNVNVSNTLSIITESAGNRPFTMQPGVAGSFGARFGVPQESMDLYTTGGYPLWFATNGPRSAIQLGIATVSSAVNYLQIAGNTTGGSPILSAQGSDTNVGININTKGAGSANVTSTANSTSNTTGALVVTGGMGITGNLFMSAANNYSLTTTDQNSYRLGWTDNYFTRSPSYGGVYFTGTFLAVRTGAFYVDTASSLITRGVISNDAGNLTVLFAGSSPVRLQNTAASTSNTTGSLIVGGGIGVSGNIYVGGTNAGVNGVYTDVLRYAANGLPWVMNAGGGGGGGTIDQWVRDTANVTIGVDASQNVRLDFSNTSLTIAQGVDNSQNVRLDFSNTRMTIIEGVDTSQNARMVIIEGTDTSQNVRLNFSNTRMDISDGVNVSQNVRIDYSNTALTIAQGVDNSQNVRLDFSNTRMTIIDGVDAGQNSRMIIIEGTDTSQNARMAIIEGTNASQNVRLDYSNTALTIAQGVDNSQNVRIDYSNTAITIIQGTNTTQNTNIAATDGKMSSAYNAANNAVANIGPVITTNSAARVIIANTTASTSNTTGSLIVSGGVGISGNIFVGGTSAGPTGVYTDILRYSANGQPWSFGGGGGSIAITNDTTNSTTLFPLLSTANSGTLSTANTSNTKLFYVPSTGTLNATIFNSLSDVEYKENIIKITNAVNTINQIDGVSFSWKENGLKSYGVIAQNIERILPELVSTAEGSKSVNYSGIIAFLINSVKELDARVKQLENK